MIYPTSGSLLNDKIHSGLSPQITIKVGSTTVGAIQRLQITQTREMLTWEEIGTDGVIEIHPKNAAKIDIQVNRIVFDYLRLPEAFGRGFVNLQAQRIPFDIQILDRSVRLNPDDAIINVYHNCWFKNYSPTYQADNFIISESGSIACEYVTTSRQGQSAAQGGLRGVAYDYDTMERATDVNGRRGRFDSTGFQAE
jgi:hypothetical protein